MNENWRMRTRAFAFLGSVAVATAAICLPGGSLAAQAPAKPAAAKPATPARVSTIKRTADGHPDLQGTYDVATMTPVERPAGVKSLTLTKEDRKSVV